MSKFRERFPKGLFGDINKDVRANRLFTIGVGMGLVLGATAPHGIVQYSVIAFGMLIVVVRTAAQYHWPDQPPPSARKSS